MTETLAEALPGRYQPAGLEGRIYRKWEESGRFAPPEQPSGRPSFTVMIPPPNVTGVLHMGHALNNTMQDVVVRHRRMAGFDALWVPGTDHAGIATQAVVERHLYEEQGLRRQDLGRERFLQEIWKWREEHGYRILEQLKRLGASCDWSRTRFTLDEDLSRAVRTAFVRLWEKGWIYRGARLVNWDCALQTAVSDDEIEYVPTRGSLWYIRYPLADEEGPGLVVATTRPETLLGDTGVAVHPGDPRYRDWVGRTLSLPLLGRRIPVVADESVDPEFGTGAVKVTPGHDPADYERGARHGLAVVNILNPDGTLNEEAGPYAGLDRLEARRRVLEDLEARGLLEKEEEIEHNVATSDRSKTAIEPLVSEQWFVRMQELARPAIEAVETGALQLKPERWVKVYLDWLYNVRDWCISRQLWWGHRIPVWYDEDGVPAASVEDLSLGSPHPVTGKPIVRQDEDVLDTWASSWLWPFATLGWPERTPDLERFYPTQFLSTARDILYLWVARMVMAGYEFVDHLPREQRCPFATCYVHATVLDARGRRMSKSLGNGIDPVEMIERYGADAVRFSLVILTREGQDVKLAENRFELGQRFCNKVWNASRFVLGHLQGPIPERPGVTLEDRWIRCRLADAVRETTRALEEYRFHDAAQTLYRFVWNDFCDWYLEAAKLRLRAAEEAGEDSDPARDAAFARRTLGGCLSSILRLLHPFTPFLTEALWEHLPGRFREDADLLMTAPWPEAEEDDRAAEIQDFFRRLQDCVRALRNVRALLEVPAGERPKAWIRADSEGLAVSLRLQTRLIEGLAGVSGLEVGTELARPAATGTDAFEGGAVYVAMPEGADAARLQGSLRKKLQKVEKGVRSLEAKLANERFLQNADPEVVEQERERLAALVQEKNTLAANLEGVL